MKPQFHRNLYLFDGRLSQRIWARGIVTDYSYDGWGSLTNTVYSDGTPTVTLLYDAMGRQTNAVDAAGVTTFRYDDYGSLTNETVVGAAGENTIVRHWDFLRPHDWLFAGRARCHQRAAEADHHRLRFRHRPDRHQDIWFFE